MEYVFACCRSSHWCKKHTLTQVFCKFHKIFKNSFFIEHLRATAYEALMKQHVPELLLQLGYRAPTWNYIEKVILTQVFSCKFLKFLRRSFLKNRFYQKVTNANLKLTVAFINADVTDNYFPIVSFIHWCKLHFFPWNIFFEIEFLLKLFHYVFLKVFRRIWITFITYTSKK